MINQLELQWQRKTRRRERDAINQWLSFASPFLSLSFLLQSAEEVLLRQNSQSVTEVSRQHCCEGICFLLRRWQSLESFWQWLWLYFNLYVCELCLWVTGIKGFYFRGEHRKTGTYSVVWAGDHGVCHPGAEPWPWCTHCDGITDASQLPTAWRSKKRKIHIYVEKVCIYSM